MSPLELVERSIPTSMVKAVIFDLYGTLLRHTQTPQVCVSMIHSAKILDFRNTLDRSSHSGRHFGRRVNTVELFPDTISTLQALRRLGVRIGMISNLTTPYKRAFHANHLGDYVQAAIFSCDCGLIKPDPRIYRLALDQLGTAPAETMMVGDSIKCDVHGSSALGISGFHLARGGVSRESKFIESLEQVIDYAGSA